jgi:hypothetical protein
MLEFDLVELQDFQKWVEVVVGLVKEKVNKIIVEARKLTLGLVSQRPME